MLELLQAIVLGIVQGLTEFIPVSSSAHLIIVPWLLKPFTGVEDFGLSFDLALHLGTLVAIVGFFWGDVVRYVRAGASSVRTRSLAGDHDRLLAWLLIIACVPGALAGVFLDSFVESFFHEPNSVHQPAAMIVIALLTIALAALLWLAESVAKHARHLEQIGLKDALLIGCAQALAVLPGVSRSGSTITMGLFAGLTHEAAARFSFLLGAPIIAGAGAKKLLDALQAGMTRHDMLLFAAGFLSAAIVGYLCIKYLLRYLQTHSLMLFVYYRFFLGALLIVLVLLGFGR
jgi:undecaprenyl-diphosphatase